MSGIEIIPYDPALKEELVHFRHIHYETGFPESRHYLEWKYERNPYLHEPVFYIARAEGRVVGMRGAYGTCWEYGNDRRTVTLPCLDDFVVDPAYRNTGLMNLLMRESLTDLARRGYEYVVNTSGGRITVMTSLVAGWKSAATVEPMMRRSTEEEIRHRIRTRVRKLRGLWRLARSSSANIVSSPEPFRRIDRMGTFAVDEANASIVASAEPRVDEMADLIARLPYDGRIRHVRNATYIRWRYQNPARQYRFLYYERGGHLEGFLALARYVECQLPTLPFHVIDWEGSSMAVREDLLRCATRVGRMSELGAWAGGLSQENRDLLDRYGFVETDIEMRKRGMPCILVKNLRGARPEAWQLGDSTILDPTRWDMRIVYTMHG